jgi:hypothetical protein
VTCPNHAYLVKHKLKECTITKTYMTTETFTKGMKPQGDSTEKAASLLPEEKVVMSIYIRPAPHESWRKLKLTSRVVNAVSSVTPEYLCAFDRKDHPDSVPKPRRFPLIVDLLVGMTWLTKALMDGGSGLNFMYLNTFDWLEHTQDRLQSTPHPLYILVLGK